MDAMQALGVLGERKPEPIWDLEADPPVLTDRERLCVWFGECQRADFSLADGYLEFAELSRGVASPDGEPTVEVDGASVTVPRAGAALWRGGDEERAPGLWETVAVGPPGYFRALTGPTGDAVHRLPTDAGVRRNRNPSVERSDVSSDAVVPLRGPTHVRCRPAWVPARRP